MDKDYIELATNLSFGEDRQMIVLIFGKLKVIESKDLLISMLDDPTIYGHALESLSKIDDGSLLPLFLKFSKCETTWIRNVANKYIQNKDYRLE